MKLFNYRTVKLHLFKDIIID